MNPDFAVFRCQIQPVVDIRIANQMGEAVQQLFFHLLERVEPALASTLHDKRFHDLKPYTVSDLLIDDRPVFTRTRKPVVIQRGQMVSLCFTGLRADVVEGLHTALFHARPAGVEIDRDFWVLNDVIVARAATIEAMISHHQQAPVPKQITVSFESPTSFRRKGHTMPFPEPTLFFSSLRRRWEEITEMPLSRLLTIFTDYMVTVGDYHLDSYPHYIQNTLFQAFDGTITYHLQRSLAQLKKDKDKFPEAQTLWQDLQNNSTRLDELSRALGLLSEFASYAGAGMKTTQGMGRVTNMLSY